MVPGIFAFMVADGTIGQLQEEALKEHEFERFEFPIFAASC